MLIFFLSVSAFAAGMTSTSAWSAAPSETLSFYGELTSQSADAPLTGNMDVALRLYDATSGGALKWQECWSSVNVQQGRLSVNLGASQAFTPSLGEFLAANPNLWLGLQVCDAGGSCASGCDTEMEPRIALGAIPYAGVALQALDVKGQTVHPALIDVAPTGA